MKSLNDDEGMSKSLKQVIAARETRFINSDSDHPL